MKKKRIKNHCNAKLKKTENEKVTRILFTIHPYMYSSRGWFNCRQPAHSNAQCNKWNTMQLLTNVCQWLDG